MRRRIVDAADAGEPLTSGLVKWFDSRRGYGFILNDDGEDVFVHYSVVEGTGFRTLQQGETVQYVVGHGPKGLSALRVKRVVPGEIDK